MDELPKLPKLSIHAKDFIKLGYTSGPHFVNVLKNVLHFHSISPSGLSKEQQLDLAVLFLELYE